MDRGGRAVTPAEAVQLVPFTLYLPTTLVNEVSALRELTYFSSDPLTGGSGSVLVDVAFGDGDTVLRVVESDEALGPAPNDRDWAFGGVVGRSRLNYWRHMHMHHAVRARVTLGETYLEIITTLSPEALAEILDSLCPLTPDV